jgi:hypothetical protein
MCREKCVCSPDGADSLAGVEEKKYWVPIR